MRYKIIALLCVFSFVFCSFALAADLTFDVDMTSERAGFPPMTITSHYFMKGEKYRVEMMSPLEDGQKMIYIFDGNKAYSYFPEKKMAMIMNMPDSVREGIDQCSRSTSKNCDCQTLAGSAYRVTGQSTGMLDNNACTICEMEAIGGNAQAVQMWLVNGTCRVIQMKSEGVNGNTIVHYYNFRENAVISDTTFALPAGTQVMGMGGMMQGAGGGKYK